MTTAAVEWVKAWSPIIVALLGILTAGAAKMESNVAKLDAQDAQDEVTLVSESAALTSDSLRLAFSKIAVLEGKVVRLQKALDVPAGRQSGAQRHRSEEQGERRPAGLTGVVSNAWRGIKSLFGG